MVIVILLIVIVLSQGTIIRIKKDSVSVQRN